MDDQKFAALVKRTLFGYSFFLGLCLACSLYVCVSYHTLSHLQVELQQTQMQETLASLHKM